MSCVTPRGPVEYTVSVTTVNDVDRRRGSFDLPNPFHRSVGLSKLDDTARRKRMFHIRRPMMEGQLSTSNLYASLLVV